MNILIFIYLSHLFVASSFIGKGQLQLFSHLTRRSSVFAFHGNYYLPSASALLRLFWFLRFLFNANLSCYSLCFCNPSNFFVMVTFHRISNFIHIKLHSTIFALLAFCLQVKDLFGWFLCNFLYFFLVFTFVLDCNDMIYQQLSRYFHGISDIPCT
jgi:hypothetical protein